METGGGRNCMKCKKLLIGFMFIVILPLLASCRGKGINERIETSKLKNIENKEIIINGEYYNRIDASNGNILYSTIGENEEKFYFTKSGNDKNPSLFFSFNIENADVLDYALSSEETAFFIILESDGTYENIYVKRIGDDKTEETIRRMNEFHGGAEDDCYDWKIIVDEEENILVYSRFAYCFMNSDGVILDEKRWEEESFYNVCFIKGGSVIVQRYINGQNETGIVDKQTKEIKIISKIPNDIYFDFLSDSDGNIIFRTDSRLFAYSIIEDSTNPILQWSDYGIVGDKIRKMYYSAAGDLSCIVLQGDTIQNVVWKPDEPIEQKTEILLGCFEEKAETRNAVVQFNNNNSDYRITIVDYWNGNEDESVKSLYNDLIAEKGPDILLLDSEYLDDWILGSKGVLEDLIPYMENSEVIRREDIVDSVYQALLSDSKLYMLPTNFSIDTMITKEEWAINRSLWTVDDIIKVLDNNPPLLENLSVSKENMLWFCMLYSMDIGISKENFSLDKTKLQKYIEFAGRMPSEVYYTSDISIRRDGKMLFEPNTFFDVKMYLQSCFEWGSEGIFIGYPEAEGNGTVIVPDNCLGINSKSKYKEKAWEFIENHFAEELQENITPSWKFSTAKKTLNKQLESSMKIDTYLDGDGNEKEIPVISYFDDIEGEMIEIYAARESDIKVIRELIDESQVIRRNASPIVNIVMEEAEYYFNGQKTVEKVIDIIDNRVELYLSE